MSKETIDHKKDPDLEEWLSHGYTKRSQRTMASRAEVFRKEFLACCRTTTDPKVAAAFARWASYQAFDEFLGGMGAKVDEE